MTMAFANQEQADFWSRIAPRWLEMDDQLALEQLGGLPATLAMDRLNLLPGQRVLDVGCGTGRTTLELAGRVGSAGAVVGVDISAELLASGRAEAVRLGVGTVEFVHGDGQVADLGEGRFDAAYSRFGVMFFADPVAAFANIRRALRAGAMLSFACWQSVFDNEWALIPGMVVVEVTGSVPPLPEPGDPGSFSLADPGRVREVLETAGFGSVDITPHNDQVVIGEEAIAGFAATAYELVRFTGALEDADQQMREQTLAGIEQAIHTRLHDGQARLSRGALLVTGIA